MSDTISNTEDVIDSRDVIERITELEATEERDELEQEELDALKALAEEGESLSDWEYGVTLIHEDYFEQYAEEFADDIGAINNPRNDVTPWPLTHIDWEAAADELKMDYTELDFDGQTYYAR